MLQPKKTKFKKYRKGRLQPKTNSLVSVNFGSLGLKSLESCRITSTQIESFRQSINRKIKRKGKIWINIFPDLPVTSKPSEVRMGKGKGAVDHWVAKVSAGKILFEVLGPREQILYKALKSAANKLPVKTYIVKRSI
jgi:large subunit ribosomal protein L16